MLLRDAVAETLTSSQQRIATIVMYHIVHGSGRGVLERLHGLAAPSFINQLQYIRRHYSPVSILDLAAACAGEGELPPRPIVLSFDDGYLGHHDIVLPLLADARIPAVFFPVAASMLDRRVLDVNKIQCILAVSDDVADLVRTIEQQIERQGGQSRTCAEYRALYWKASRWDPPEIVYVKRLLQHGLPEALRRSIVDDLFATRVTRDERGFAEQLYLSAAHAQAMRAAGMTIGAHGDRHVRLSTLSKDGQAAEIDGALRVLAASGTADRPFAYSYANGDHNADSIALLASRGCAVAVTTVPELIEVGRAAPLTLPRIDANDLPIVADAPPNAWTTRAGGELAS